MPSFRIYLIWYFSLILTLAFTWIMFIYISLPRINAPQATSHYRIFKALPSVSMPTQEISIGRGDARALIVRDFLKSYKSPLHIFADKFIEVADKYQLNFRLLPAIAMQESGGGKKAPEGSYNPFGYGVYGKKVTKFNSWEEAISKVGENLKHDYLDQGLSTPFEIMSKYTSPRAQSGEWANGILLFMNQMH